YLFSGGNEGRSADRPIFGRLLPRNRLPCASDQLAVERKAGRTAGRNLGEKFLHLLFRTNEIPPGFWTVGTRHQKEGRRRWIHSYLTCSRWGRGIRVSQRNSRHCTSTIGRRTGFPPGLRGGGQ